MARKSTIHDVEQRLSLFKGKSSEYREKLDILAREKKEFLSIFNSLDVGVSVSDPVTCEILYANTTVRKAYGYQKILGQKCHKIFQGHDKPCDFCTNPIIFGKGKGQPYIYDFRNQLNGRWFHCIDKAIQWPDGRWVRWEMAINIDVQKRAEQDLLESKSNLERLMKIEDKMTSLGRVAAGMAHEIRSPLSGINLLLDNLMNICRPSNLRSVELDNFDEIKLIIEKALTASQKIEKVINRVLDFSRPVEVKRVLTNINKPIQDALRLSDVTLRKEGIQIETDFSSDCPPCYVDPDLIQQVMMGLIANAIEAMENLGREKKIAIRSFKEGDNVVIRVSDSGTGVPEAIRDKIFDPFFTTKPYGSGIGLSICHRIVKDHQGLLEISSSELKGAEFSAKIPVPSSQEN